ncbi:Metalloreductase STEAP4 [Smittium culicis]|uniref:Metalloreductase STEAP4 n=1 Tax=Smittium culicis TaxID=133412 RepID=A0A1R1X9M7_9FUNG|nr:Metalloreductase STEAP4 [Smittium culicis]
MNDKDDERQLLEENKNIRETDIFGNEFKQYTPANSETAVLPSTSRRGNRIGSGVAIRRTFSQIRSKVQFSDICVIGYGQFGKQISYRLAISGFKVNIGTRACENGRADVSGSGGGGRDGDTNNNINESYRGSFAKGASGGGIPSFSEDYISPPTAPTSYENAILQTRSKLVILAIPHTEHYNFCRIMLPLLDGYTIVDVSNYSLRFGHKSKLRPGREKFKRRSDDVLAELKGNGSHYRKKSCRDSDDYYFDFLGNDCYEFSLAERIQSLLPKSYVVKALSNISAIELSNPYNNAVLSTPVASNSAFAAQRVCYMLREIGVVPVLSGLLTSSADIEYRSFELFSKWSVPGVVSSIIFTLMFILTTLREQIYTSTLYRDISS